MKWTENLKNTYKGMGYSVSRFPITVLFLVAIAILNAFMIERSDFDFTRLIFTFMLGGVLGVVAEMVYERFELTEMMRYALFGGTIGLTLLYYLLIGPQAELNLPISIKTMVSLFALFIAFIWIPTIDNVSVTFHRNFLAVFKALFTTLLFSLVLAGGISAIFSAINLLLFQVDFTILGHLMNVIATLFAPIYFLSMIPTYGNMARADDNESVSVKEIDQFSVPRFLEILISYIIIPLVGVYTLILIIYVVINFTGDFWTDNLLEPLLVSYAIIVLVVLLLSYNLENRFAVGFRTIFPKVLLPIVLFQTLASILKIGEMGITHGRYYVILFGVFAIIASVIFGFMKVKHHGYVAVALLALATLSIIPPIDAFTVSKKNQIQFLQEKLSENNMLENNQVIPNEDIPVEDKIAITKAALYIQELGYTNEVAFLPNNTDIYAEFSRLFGFNQTFEDYELDRGMSQYVNLEYSDDYTMDISRYDVYLTTFIYSGEPFENKSFEIEGETYHLKVEESERYSTLKVVDSKDTEIIRYNLKDIYDDLFGEESETLSVPGTLSLEEAQFETENDQAYLKILVISLDRNESYNSSQLTLYLEIKE